MQGTELLITAMELGTAVLLFGTALLDLGLACKLKLVKGRKRERLRIWPWK